MPISRVLYLAESKVLIIYLGLQLLTGSSGIKREHRGNVYSSLLAADRVYLSRMLPCATVVSYTGS